MEGAQALAEGGELSGGVGGQRRGGKLEDGAAVGGKGEGDVRVRERGEREVVVDVRAFGLLGAQEFSAGRQVKEELAHFDACAAGRTGGADFQNLAAVDDDLCGLR